ncbi:MAG: hypothetical protein VKI81_03310 [Synechococcaceae cyanobacterium]|nr:hypothetical protein [Synechococcaceae cyanobacterium]
MLRTLPIMRTPDHGRRRLALLAAGLLSAAALPAALAAETPGPSPIRLLLEQGQGRLLYIYDGIRHVELPLRQGRAVIGLSCDRNTWTLFRIERGGREIYSFRDDPRWGYQPAGDIASSRLCRDPIRIAE